MGEMNLGNVVVDVGNTKIKTALFNDQLLVSHFNADRLEDVKNHYSGKSYRWIFSSVGDDTDLINRLFSNQNTLILTHKTPLPISIDYETPHTLGLDRIASAVGAYLIYGSKILVIDAGTCITYDVIVSGKFLGGIISPGLKMRMKSMSMLTRKLPDISEEWEQISVEGPLGKSTKACMKLGAYESMVHEMNGNIENFLKDYGDLDVILTGGDAPHFESKLKAPIFANSNLVLEGLNRILNHNK